MERSMQNTIRTYISRIKNNNLDYHMILYSNSHLFEYNPKTKEFRPFNSIKWYELDDDLFYNILRYLDSIYEILSSYDNPDINQEVSMKVGNTILIDLSKLTENLKRSIPNVKATTFTELCLKNSITECNNLIEYISDIYDKWNRVALFILNNYEDIEDLL